MRSDTTQLDVFRDDPARKAKEWRDAAEASRQQFPDDHKRYEYFNTNAERWEAIAG